MKRLLELFSILCILYTAYTAISGIITIHKRDHTIAALQDALDNSRFDPFNNSDTTSWIILKRTEPRLTMTFSGDSVIVWPFPRNMDSTQTITWRNIRQDYWICDRMPFARMPFTIFSRTEKYGIMFFQGGKSHHTWTIQSNVSRYKLSKDTP